ncbi:hypothetical protein G6L37_04865 [Agrobacterium rubi]|nr:hypothetical protein [Agrobacterium rubi]NTF24686.1 hypothetical protein [Agrobacterium rubi]
MKTMTRLEDYLENAPMKSKIALAAAGTLLAALMAVQVLPVTKAEAAELHPSRTAEIVTQTSSEQSSELGGRDRNVDPARLAQIKQHTSTPYKSDAVDKALAFERMRPMPNVVVEDISEITKLNERTSDLLRDANEIATRFHESKAWTGEMFTPEQKAKNIGTALQLAHHRADHPELAKLDNYIVALREDLPDNRLLNNITADLNFKRETLRNATLELNAMMIAMKDDRQDDVEKHRFMTETILKDAGYALSARTDWSVEAGHRLSR